MVVNLQKGQKTDLTKGNAGLSKIVVGLGWDVNKYDGQADFDLDASAFLLDANGKALIKTDSNGRVTSDSDMVFYGNLKHISGSVAHTGDNLTGEGEGDDEQIKVDLSAVPSNVEAIAFTVTIYDASNRKQNFGQVSNAFVRIFNEENNEELIRYDLGEDYSVETALVVGKLYRKDGEWKFEAIGSGYNNGLEGLLNDFAR